MLLRDRDMVDNNWKLMKQVNYRPYELGYIPSPYPEDVDGYELTLHFMEDFEKLIVTSQTKPQPINRDFIKHMKYFRSLLNPLPPGWQS